MFYRSFDSTTFFHYTVGRLSSQLLIFFKSPDFFPMVLQQQLTALDFVSYCGGSLGLLLGFSALSAVELLYYFTLRLIFKRLRRNRVEDLSAGHGEQKKNYLVEFLENSSVHGCNQVVMKDRSWFERFEGDMSFLKD
jgi:hypothetical protein